VAIVIPPTSTTDDYVTVNTGLAVSGSLVVANASADIILMHAPSDGTALIVEDPAVTVSPATGGGVPFSAGAAPGQPIDLITGFKIKSSVAGTPAVYSGSFIAYGQAGIGAGSAFVGTLTPGGGYTPASMTSPTFVSLTVSDTVTSYTVARPVVVEFQVDVEPTVAPSIQVDYHNLDVVLSTTSANLNNNVQFYAIETNAQNGGPANMNGLVPLYSFANNLGGGTVDHVWQLRMLLQQKAASHVNNAYGVRYEVPLIGDASAPTIGNLYAVWVDDIASSTQVSSANAYSFYAVSGLNHFGGAIILGGTPGSAGAGVRYLSGAGGADSWYMNATAAGAIYLAANEVTAIQIQQNKLGFYGVPVVARQVLATGTGKTVDDVITALQNLGLVSQT